METDEPVSEGFLFLPPSGKILKKAWQKKYCILYKRSSSGIARLEIFDNETRAGQAKIIILEDVIKITPKSSNIINVVTKHTDMEFGTTSDDSMNNWFGALKSVAFPDESACINSIEQDNDLYCSADEGVFSVKLHHSEASQRCNLASKNYTLVVTSSSLQLWNEDDNKLLYTWPFSYIRKYGYKGGKFTFEAGRKCASGEGIFNLEHPNHNEIFRCLSTRMKNMKKILNGESTPSLIDCGDIQLQAALSMEAGSRNPLPPSIQGSYQDSSNPSLGIAFPSSVSSVENLHTVKAVPKKPPRKSVSMKNIAQTPIVTHNATHEYAELDKYDVVESRTQAWKTMGVEDPPHSDSVLSGLEDTYASWGITSEIPLNEKTSAPAVIKECATSSMSQYYDFLNFGSSTALNAASGFKKGVTQINKSIENLTLNDESLPHRSDENPAWRVGPLTKSLSEIKLTEKKQAPTVIAEPIRPSEKGYYHLNFFGQSSAPSSDYIQVSTSIVPCATPTPNLYEEVNVMESARSADDSHLGYACIKKDSARGTLKEVEDDSRACDVNEETQRVAHQFQNHQPYAVISKPKRV